MVCIEIDLFTIVQYEWRSYKKKINNVVPEKNGSGKMSQSSHAMWKMCSHHFGHIVQPWSFEYINHIRYWSDISIYE